MLQNDMPEHDEVEAATQNVLEDTAKLVQELASPSSVPTIGFATSYTTE